MVILMEHWEIIYDIPKKVLADMLVVVKKVSVAVKKAVEAEGINIVQCNEKAAFQDVMHFHVHVIRRFEGDAMTKTVQPYYH